MLYGALLGDGDLRKVLEFQKSTPLEYTNKHEKVCLYIRDCLPSLFLNKTKPSVYGNKKKIKLNIGLVLLFLNLVFHRNLWYIKPLGRVLKQKGKKIREFYKPVPLCVDELFDQQMRLHWFIGDGFWES